MPPDTLFFNPAFKLDFDWKGFLPLRIGSVLPHNREQISDSLQDMSHETIRNRFSGSKKAFTEEELKYLTVLDGQNHYAIGIEEREGAKRGVGLIRMVRSSTDPEEAEIALALIDSYQNMGLGSVLLYMIILAAAEREIKRLSFTFLRNNEGIVKLIHKAGTPVPGAHGIDDDQLFLEMSSLDLKGIIKKLTPTFSEIRNFRP